jgi:hypothetical protein
MNRKFYKVDSTTSTIEEVVTLKRRIKGFEEMTKTLSNALDVERKLNESMQKDCICRKSNLTRRAA